MAGQRSLQRAALFTIVGYLVAAQGAEPEAGTQNKDALPFGLAVPLQPITKFLGDTFKPLQPFGIGKKNDAVTSSTSQPDTELPPKEGVREKRTPHKLKHFGGFGGGGGYGGGGYGGGGCGGGCGGGGGPSYEVVPIIKAIPVPVPVFVGGGGGGYKHHGGGHKHYGGGGGGYPGGGGGGGYPGGGGGGYCNVCGGGGGGGYPGGGGGGGGYPYGGGGGGGYPSYSSSSSQSSSQASSSSWGKKK